MFSCNDNHLMPLIISVGTWSRPVITNLCPHWLSWSLSFFRASSIRSINWILFCVLVSNTFCGGRGMVKYPGHNIVNIILDLPIRRPRDHPKPSFRSDLSMTWVLGHMPHVASTCNCRFNEPRQSDLKKQLDLVLCKQHFLWWQRHGQANVLSK